MRKNDFTSECQICNCIAKHDKEKLCELHKCKFDLNGNYYSLEKQFCNAAVCSDSYSYCYFHNCKIPTCKNESSFATFCNAHTCKMDSCSSSKLEDDEVCKPCKLAIRCVIPTCFAVHKGQALSKDGRWICDDHGCRFPECEKAQHKKSSFCIDHKCTKCENIATKEGGECHIHKEKKKEKESEDDKKKKESEEDKKEEKTGEAKMKGEKRRKRKPIKPTQT